VACACKLTIQQGAPEGVARGCGDRETEPDMTTYPVEFHRRFEQKWARRAGVSRACESTPRAARASRNQPVICLGRAALVTEGALPPNQQESDEVLARVSWLLAIGQGLRAECNTIEQPVPERLAALLKELEGSPAVPRLGVRRKSGDVGPCAPPP
jgi:hypothetical protein